MVPAPDQAPERVPKIAINAAFRGGRPGSGGQGDHKYSPIQMARYVSAIANNGYLNKVKVVKEIESSDKKDRVIIEDTREKIQLNNANNLSYIRQGMEDVSDEGTARAFLMNFPIKVASKTGTAQKTGSIPAIDE